MIFNSQYKQTLSVVTFINEVRLLPYYMKKRLWVVLTILSLILSSLSVLSFTEYEIVSEVLPDVCDDPGDAGCDQTLLFFDNQNPYSFETFSNGLDCETRDGDELPSSFPYSGLNGITKACYISVREVDDRDVLDFDDCGWIAMKEGSLIGTTEARALNILKNEEGNPTYASRGTIEADILEFFNDDPAEGGTGEGKQLVVNTYEFMCGDDEMWLRCDGGGIGQSTTIEIDGEPGVYYCLRTDDNKYVWVNATEISDSVDRDSDNVPDYFDCAPDNDKVYPAWPFGCDSDLNDDLECILPAAAEICGDNLNNDCQGWTPGQNAHTNTRLANAGNGDSSDNCNENQYACQGQKIITYGEDEGRPADVDAQYSCETGKCYVPSEGGCLEQGGICSWADNGPEDSRCCGVQGIDDLGKLTTDGSAICLADDDEYVGVPDATDVQESLHWDYSGCQGEWCWVRPSGDNQFKVITIKEPGEKPYDIVSDSAKWHICSEEQFTGGEDVVYLADQALGVLDDDSTTTDEEQRMKANHFACYGTGAYYAWAECRTDPADLTNNNIKGRLAGDGLSALYIDEDGQEIASSVVLRPVRGQYNAIYQRGGEDAVFDFRPFNQLEFFVQFVENDGNPRPWANLVLPVDVMVAMYGKEEDGYPLLFQKNILGDIVNKPAFSLNSPMHIRTNIPEGLSGVGKVEISSVKPDGTVSNNLIKVQNIFLSTKGEQPAICSGEENRGGPNWLGEFDDNSDPSFNAAGMCRAHYGDSAWLGVETGINQVNCCGDDNGEFYAGPVAEDMSESGAGQRYGCWNSQVIAAGETTMNVGVENLF